MPGTTPEAGCLTALTYGLSLADHPEWRFGRSELLISVNTTDPSWALAVADIAAAHRGEWPFLWGTTIRFHGRISEDSKMSGFAIFAPSLVGRALPREDTSIQLSGYKVHLSGMYPIYEGEAALIGRIGLEEFWHLDGFDPWEFAGDSVYV